MKRMLFSRLLLLLLAALFALVPSDSTGAAYEKLLNPITRKPHGGSYRIASYNILTATALQKKDDRNFHDVRAALIRQTLEEIDADIFCFQEVTPYQYEFLNAVLGNYESVVTFRDGKKLGEASPIFYDPKIFTRVDSGTFWLSETPDEISYGWGAACRRVCTWVTLETSWGFRFNVFNTHLDHISEEARVNGMKLILNRIEKSGLPCLLTGDMNCANGSEAIRLAQKYLADAFTKAKESDTGVSYHDFGRITAGSPIDRIFATEHIFDLEKTEILRRRFNGKFSSDHDPVVLDYRIAVK